MPMEIMDAQSALSFVTRQAAHIEPQVYQIKYPDLQYTDLVPIDTSAGEWADTVEFYSSDKVGEAKWFNHTARDVPRADVTRTQHSHSIEMAAIGYGYTLAEIGKASRLGINLSADRAMSARRAYEEFVDSIVFNGDTGKGWTGLYNDANVNAANMANDGTGDSRLWSTKTPTQILRDINEGLTAVVTGTRRTEIADTLLLPLTGYTYIGSQPMSVENPNMTILQFVLQNNIYTAMTGRPLTIKVGDGLEDAGSGSTGRMVAYRKDPQVLKLHLPVPLRFLPVWQTGPMAFEVPGYFRLGGLEIRLPGAVKYRDGLVG
ncbi:DUF2184 domain-containing protein [Marinicauda sp. Alg238-R41]|uniref:DUF2184 domain-containing protein n=1 Tax=Marinicauda sp. Alg238-R41 TaxID=2993447 RepID=UPI0022E6C02F|nr:major capsid family protein [Marinicauda sp. Alg238-R41]